MRSSLGHSLAGAFGALLAAIAGVASARAAAWPTNTVHIVVPFPPGGPTDVVARVLAQKMSESVGQSVIVDNRPGADGNLGAISVAKSAPDGLTLLFVVPAIITNTFFQKGGVDVSTSLKPVVLLNRVPNILLVKNDLPVKSVEDLATMARSRPGAVSCASSGSLPTLGCEWFKALSKADVTMVRYAGNAPASIAVQGGEVTMMFDVANTAAQSVKAGTVKALATTNPRPMTGFFAALPTMSATYPGFEMVSWQGLMAPRDTPADIVDAINAAANKALADPEILGVFARTDLAPAGGSAAFFEDLIKADTKRYGEIIASAGIKPN